MDFASPAGLLAHPITYDIVIGDFGRDATIEYLRLMCAEEKRRINEVLAPSNRPFFDEYRRIMFTTLADIHHFKRRAIATAASQQGFLAEDILLGVGFSPITTEFEELLIEAVAREAEAAARRGYRKMRVLLPCNGLSVVYDALTKGLASMRSGAYRSQGLDEIDIRMHTVPQSVIKKFAPVGLPEGRGHLLILGTPGVNALYKTAGAPHNVSVVPLTATDYALISEAIVISIGGAKEQVKKCRERIRSEIILPSEEKFPGLAVVEACTDFDLGLGVSSLALFAESMVANAYMPQTREAN